jgi:hypothetical protein
MEQSCQGKIGMAGNEKPVKMINELPLEKEARSSFSMKVCPEERKDKLTVKDLLGHNEHIHIP